MMDSRVEDVEGLEGNVRGIQVLSVGLSDAESGMRDIDSGDVGLGKTQGEGDGNAAAAGTNIEDAESFRPAVCLSREDPLTEGFSFGTGDEHTGLYMKRTAAEIGGTQDILYRLTGGDARQDGVKSFPLIGAELSEATTDNVGKRQAKTHVKYPPHEGSRLALWIERRQPLPKGHILRHS
jgi:hypothetical protein